MGSFECRTDAEKNRVYITLSGFFRAGDVEPSLQELRSALTNVQPGFDVVTDLSGFVPGSPAAADALKRGGELVKQQGRRNAVRITGGLLTGLMQFQRLLRGVFEEDSVKYAKNLVEADEILDDWPG